MRPPTERAGDAARGTTGQAALVVAVGAALTGALAMALAALWLVPIPVLPTGEPEPVTDTAWGLATLAPTVAVVSWILAVAAVLTALAARRQDAGDRRARIALRTALPGAVLGTLPVLVVLGWIVSWSLDR